MPYTDDFQKILNRYMNQYNDKSRAYTFAFDEAFKKGIKTFRDRESLFKRQNNVRLGDL